MHGIDRHKGRAGFSLVEILVATVILVIIFTGWLRIANFQAIRKESLRRAAIEKAAGYLDVMVGSPSLSDKRYYRINWTNSNFKVDEAEDEHVYELFNNDLLIGYTLQVLLNYQEDWPAGSKWAVIKLYDRNGIPETEAGRPFSTMSVLIP